MSLCGKAALGRLPGEPKKMLRPLTESSETSTNSMTPTIARLTVKDVRQLLGKSAYPVYLDLSPSQYNLEDDTFLTNCTNVIKFLDLSSNSLTELECLGHLSKLKMLYADRNLVTSVSYRGLTGLELLSLKQNNLSSLGDMGDLKKLVNLDLSNNHVAHGFDELAKLKSLRVLDLSWNRIEMGLGHFHASVMTELMKMPRLEYLSMEGNPVETSLQDFRLYVVHHLPKLRFLDWCPVTREERSRAQRMEEEGLWAEKGKAPHSRHHRSKSKETQAAVSGEPLPQPPPHQPGGQRLSSTLDSLLAEIDQLGLLDASTVTETQGGGGALAASPLSAGATVQESPEPEAPLSPLEKGRESLGALRNLDDSKIDEYLDLLGDVSVETRRPQAEESGEPTAAAAAIEGETTVCPAATVVAPAKADDSSSLLDIMNEMLVEEQAKKQRQQKPAAAAATLTVTTLPAELTRSVDVSRMSPDVVGLVEDLGRQSAIAVIETRTNSASPTSVEPARTPTGLVTPVNPSKSPNQAKESTSPQKARSQGMTLDGVDAELADMILPTKKPSAPISAEASPTVVAAIRPPVAVSPSEHAKTQLDLINQALAELQSSSQSETQQTKTVAPPKPVFQVKTGIVPFGSLTLISKLGEGALGDTWLSSTSAQGIGTKKPIAVKRLRPQRFATPFVEEFSKEVTRLSGVPKHRNVVGVLCASIDTTICYITEFVSGRSLSAFLASQRSVPIPQQQAMPFRLRVARGLAEGVAYLHEHGIVHGTLKPTDVILADDEDGAAPDLVPKIRDYGFCFAKLDNLREGALFSPQFLPPETFSQELFRGLVPESDVYSLGLCLWLLFEGGRWGLLDDEPAPQELQKLRLSFSQTPAALADIVSQCCNLDATKRPTAAKVVEMLSRPDDELLEVQATAQRNEDPEVTDRRHKLGLVCVKLVELLETPSDAAQLKALSAIQSMEWSRLMIDSLLKAKVVIAALNCLKSAVPAVLEQCLRLMTALCCRTDDVRVLLQLADCDKTAELVLALYGSRSDVVVMLAVRFTAVMLKSEAAQQRFHDKGIINAVLLQLASRSDLVVANAAWACARMMKYAPTRDIFASGKGVATLLQLLSVTNPAVQANLLSALSRLLSNETAQRPILSARVSNRLLPLLAGKAELLQLNALKSVTVCLENESFMRTIDVPEWLAALCKLLLHTPNAKIITRSCSALAKLAKTEEDCDRLESLGVMPMLVSFLKVMHRDTKLQAQALSLLSVLLQTCASCRDSFRDCGGLDPLTRLYVQSEHNAEVQHACLRVFLALAAEESALDVIAEAGVVSSVVRQMAAASFRRDSDRLLTALRLVRALSQGAEVSTSPIRQAGGIQKLLDLVTNYSGPQAETVQYEAGMALAALVSDEDAVKSVASCKGGFCAVFSLLAHHSPDLQEALLRQFSILSRSPEVAEILFAHGVSAYIVQSIDSPSVPVQALALKAVLLLASTATDRRAQLIAAGVIPAVERLKSREVNPTLSLAAERALAFLNR